ncbi:hypothetical protein WA158_008086 [Blastocystis sp. Blastoise]
MPRDRSISRSRSRSRRRSRDRYERRVSRNSDYRDGGDRYSSRRRSDSRDKRRSSSRNSRRYRDNEEYRRRSRSRSSSYRRSETKTDSRSNEKDFYTRKVEKKEIPKKAVNPTTEDGELDIAAIMGFGSFTSTKGKPVETNKTTAAKGACRCIKQRDFSRVLNKKAPLNTNVFK